MHRFWILFGSLAAFAAMAVSALAAHVLPRRLSPHGLDLVHTGVEVAMWHALALIACGVWAERRQRGIVHAAGTALLIGTIAFCSGIAALASGWPLYGPLIPTGGALLMLGWLLFAASALHA